MWGSTLAVLVVSTSLASEVSITSTTFNSDQTWYGANTYVLSGQVFFEAGATLTIQKGTTIKAARTGSDGKDTVLVFKQGARIEAHGTATEPITFTSLAPVNSTQRRGLWGGVVICGHAPIAAGGTNMVEGLTGVSYGGTNATDYSGTLRYVRIWHGGADIGGGIGGEGSGNEINGLTLAGVGSSTIVEYVEVAFNLDDGFEIFGGTVNLKYCSSIFNGDDAYDIDEGYQGKMQFIFAIVDKDGNHAAEMDSKTNGNPNAQPRSYPQLYGATFFKAVHNTSGDGLMELREGTGGRFGNIILYGRSAYGVQNSGCGNETRSSTVVGSVPDSLYFSSNSIIYTQDSSGRYVQFNTSCSESSTWVNPTARAVDPKLQLIPSVWTTVDDLFQIDPRPIPTMNSWKNVDNPPSDDFFSTTDYIGAFGTSLWLDRWSYLSENSLIPGADVFPTISNVICGNVSTPLTLKENQTYFLTCQTLVLQTTLTIEKGVTIKAYRQDANGKAPSIIVQRDGRIEATGTADLPITFTSVLPERNLPQRGTWGGLILLGNAPIAKAGGRNDIEGLEVPFGRYGGVTKDDNSGTLKYVRVWYGGADIGFDTSSTENSGNEINGITFGGVGSGTTVQHVEVAWNKDDGFEMFGGTVNLKYCSAVFNQDDSFDSDEGYQGKMQFIFALLDNIGDHACEMDSKTNGDIDSSPRSFPQIYGATFIKANHSSSSPRGLMRLREGTGGVFSNIILGGKAEAGMENKDCSMNVAKGSWENGNGGNSMPDYLWWSRSNIINTKTNSGQRNPFQLGSDCVWSNGPTSRETDPQFQLLRDGWNDWTDLGQIDPRPRSSSPAFTAFDNPPSELFYSSVSYAGAFGSELWNDKWSWLSVFGLLPTGNQPSAADNLCGEITSSMTLYASTTYYLTCQTFVKAPAVLTIEAGTTIRAYYSDSSGRATALVIEQGAKIFAEGSKSAPITFTNALHSQALPKRQTWGGLIILGRAPIANGGTNSVEGLDPGLGTYGGTNSTDSSGSLKYVRVWYGGADIGGPRSENSGNEINGITLAGVGSSTTLELCEVAWNNDDGFEFFGGTVNARWLSSIYNKDDAFDVDEGYQGSMQFLFGLVDFEGNHALEIDSMTGGNVDSSPRTFVDLYGATFIKADQVTNDALMRIREGAGGRYANIVALGKSRYSLLVDTCGTVTYSQMDGGGPDLLYLAPENYFSVTDTSGNTAEISTECTWVTTPSVSSTDPSLLLTPFQWTNHASIAQLDPRPSFDSEVYRTFATPPSGNSYLVPASFAGAFGSDLWLESWSYLAVNHRLPENEYPTSNTTLCGPITDSRILPADTYYLTCSVYVKSGATLTLNPGTTIKAYAQDSTGKATILVIEQGAKIMASGYANYPITFTSVLPEISLPRTGTWGGVLVLGKARINSNSSIDGTANVEGLRPGYGIYGGFDDADNSGILRYVRIWYAGADQDVITSTTNENSGNEINGLTLAGVGSATSISYVEVAYSLDDGIEVFGGTVALDHVAAYFCQDDQFDFDSGYRGQVSYAFAMVGATGHRSIECDSFDEDSDTISPRTRVEISQSTFIGNPVDVGATVLFRNGAAGVIALSIVSNAVGAGIAQESCSGSQANTTTSQRPNSTVAFQPQALYVDPFSIISTTASQITFDTTCATTARPVSALSTLNLRLLPSVPTESSKMIDPRPYHSTLGPWRVGKDSWRVAAFSGLAPFSGNGFSAKGYNGAFESDLWIHQWSWLSLNAFLPDNEWTGDSSRLLGGRYSSSLTLSQGTYYLLTNMFMESGTVLTIPAGTTIKAYAQDASGLAPAVVIKTGARIEATGTISSPITFTTVLPPTLLPRRGTWGGIIVLGEATVQDQAQSGQIEGITGNDGQFGGTNDDDNSGTLTYVRVWYGGADISDSSGINENEINGITFGGVGSGTKVSYCEVAYNLDDGFELFGGTVDLKYCSSVFNGDDAFDIDLGYRGRMQFLFALVGSKGDHAAEVDSKSGGSVDAQPRSFPQIYGATFVGGAPDNTRGSVVRIREGSAGIFSNMVITNGETGIENKDCGAENRTQTSPGGVADMQYLYLYDKNVVFNSHGGGFTQILLDNATCTYPEGYPLAVNTNPSILNLPYSATEIGVIQGLDPRPDACGELYRDVDTPYETTFFSSTTYKGAFGVTNWLKGLSILDDVGILASSGVPGVCQTNTGSVVSGDLAFPTATCDDSILATATAEVKARLSSYTGVAIPSVTVVGQCGSIIFQYSVAFTAGQVSEANSFATTFVNAPSSVLGANIVTMYGPPVATAQNFIGDDTNPTPAPTQSPTLPPISGGEAKQTLDRTKETAFMALMVVFFVLTIPAAVGLYMALRTERRFTKKRVDRWWALALEGNESNVWIPEEIDIFRKIQDEDASEWIKRFEEFHFKITMNAKLKKLLVAHGRQWKIKMFRFLSKRLVQEEDFQIVDEKTIHYNKNTKIKSFKAGFLTQAVLTMAEIDADMFIKESNSEDDRLRDSLRLIKEATKHGSLDQELTIKGLLLYAILNKISNFIQKASGAELASDLSIDQWAKMTNLLRVTLRSVCTPTRDEQLFVISVDPSGVKFATERLCNTASVLLNGGTIRELISTSGVRTQVLKSSSRTARYNIQVRAGALRAYKESFDTISRLMEFSRKEMTDILKDRKKRQVLGKKRERKGLKDSFLLPGSPANQCLNACVDALSTTKEFKGRIEAIENSLIFSIGTLEAANNKAMAGLHKIAARTLGGHGGETAGMGDIRLLMPQQVAEISKQLVIANRTKTNIYRAYMSGVKIAVRVLDVGSIRGPIKQAILRHQKLSHTPFVVQLFGVGFSRKHGWFIAMEYIEKTLNDILNAWPPLLLDIRMQIAADIASALQYLHTARVHHGNINPFTILVTNSLQIKITDFTLSTDLDDDEKNNTYVGTFQTISAGTTSVSTGSTMGNSYFKAPEVHVQIPAQNFVLSPQSIMKLDVFSFGAVLTELLSGAGARLSSVLPSDLPALYYQFLKQAGAISSPTTTGEIKATDELSPSPEEIKKAKLVATSVVLSKDKQFEIAFDLEPFRLPNVVVPIVEKMISLKAENRPDMKLVRERIVRLKNRVKAGTEEKLNMQYLKAEHIQEIEKHLIFNNRLKNTKNVYKISLFGLDVVVKLLGSENWSEEVKLHHQVSRDNPHVVDMFGCGFSHKMGWFLCMEYVQYTLSDLIFAAAPPPDSTLLQMAIDMVDGFAMLHAKGISHRDVKPLNILVTSDFKIRICDFGISTKMRRKESIDVGNFTQQQLQEMQHAGIKAAVGTPVYMAPEQHIRKDKELSRKASEMVDVYGFGVCLLEMFGGIPLKDLLPLQVDLYYKQRNCKGRDMAVELPKQNKMRRIPGPVMVIIRGCMSWDPSFRPTMDRVKIALEAFQKSAEGAKMELRRQLSTKHNARNYGIGMGESARLYQSGLKPGGGLVSAPDVIQTNSLMSPPITPANVLRAGRSASMMQIMSKETLMALSQMAPDLAIDIKPEGKPETEVKASRRASAVRKGKGNQPEQTEIGERETSITRSRIRPVSTVRPDFAETPHGSELRFYEDANQPLV